MAMTMKAFEAELDRLTRKVEDLRKEDKSIDGSASLENLNRKFEIEAEIYRIAQDMIYLGFEGIVENNEPEQAQETVVDSAELDVVEADAEPELETDAVLELPKKKVDRTFYIHQPCEIYKFLNQIRNHYKQRHFNNCACVLAQL